MAGSPPDDVAEARGEREATALAEAEARHRRELDALREEFHRELMRKSFRIAELEVRGGAPHEAVAETIKEYESTLSWRVTTPLRAVRNLFARR
jgi:hypothetical protein